MSSPSPAPGAKPKQDPDHTGSEGHKRGARKKKRDDARMAVEVELAHARNRQLFWGAFGLVVGAALVWKFGTVGKGLGVLLLAVAAWNARGVAATLLNPPGTIRVTPSEVQLPRGLCTKSVDTVPLTGVRHAFFLRRAVPWTRSGPVLIVETADHTFAYPRDWFTSESDQRRVCTAVNSLLERS